MEGGSGASLRGLGWNCHGGVAGGKRLAALGKCKMQNAK